MDPFTGITNPAVTPIIGTNPDSGIATTQLFLSNFISLAFGIAGTVTIFMLLWGGFEYVTAGGDKEAAQRAAKRMTNAFIGLALILSLFAIITIIQTLFGIPILNFNIPIIK